MSIKIVSQNQTFFFEDFTKYNQDKRKLFLDYLIILLKKQSQINRFLSQDGKVVSANELGTYFEQSKIIMVNTKQIPTTTKCNYNFRYKNGFLKMKSVDDQGQIVYQTSLSIDVIKNINLNYHNLLMQNQSNNDSQNESQTRDINKKISLKELYQHDRPSDAWICLENKVYNITSYIDRHPGGPIIKDYLGSDATVIFKKIHSKVNLENILKTMMIGEIE